MPTKKPKSKTTAKEFSYSPAQTQKIMAAVNKAGLQDGVTRTQVMERVTNAARTALWIRALCDTYQPPYARSFRKGVERIALASQTLVEALKELDNTTYEYLQRVLAVLTDGERVQQDPKAARLSGVERDLLLFGLCIEPLERLQEAAEIVNEITDDDDQPSEVKPLLQPPGGRSTPSALAVGDFSRALYDIYYQATVGRPSRGTVSGNDHTLSPSPYHLFIDAAIRPTDLVDPTTKLEYWVRQSLSGPTGQENQIAKILVWQAISRHP